MDSQLLISAAGWVVDFCIRRTFCSADRGRWCCEAVSGGGGCTLQLCGISCSVGLGYDTTWMRQQRTGVSWGHWCNSSAGPGWQLSGMADGWQQQQQQDAWCGKVNW